MDNCRHIVLQQVYCGVHGVKLTCPKCDMIARGQKGGGAQTEAQKKWAQEFGKRSVLRFRANMPESQYTTADCLQTFRAEPLREFTAKDVVEAAPEVKRTSALAKNNVFAKIGYLYRKGWIRRVREGVYQLNPASDSTKEE